MEYHKKLSLFFKSKGVSQKEVGQKTGVSKSMISKYFSGSVAFDAKFVVMLVKEFPNVDLKYIFTEDSSVDMVAEESSPVYGFDLEKEIGKIKGELTEIKELLAQNCHTK